MQKIMLGPFVLGLSALALASCGGGDDGIELRTEKRNLEEVNNSGYAGEVLLASPGDSRTLVTLAMGEGETLTGSFPAAIHRGSCEGLSGEQLHDLGTLEAGLLNQTVPASLDDLTGGDHAVVVFESGQRSVYVACADLD